MDKTQNTNKTFLLTLRTGDKEALKIVYKEAYPICATFILNNSGTKEDAKDLFQEAIIILIQKLKQPDFKLTANIKTYMYAIVRNLWLKKLRTDTKKGLELIIDEPNINFQLPQNDNFEYQPEIEDRHEAVETAFSSLSEECQKIITAFYYQKLSLKEIASWLDYTDNFIKVKKKRCMDTLRDKVFSNSSNNNK